MRITTLLALSITVSASNVARSELVVTLSDDGSGGVLATFMGSGASVDSTAAASFQELGDYTTVEGTSFYLLSPVTTSAGANIIAIRPDDDTTNEATTDDFSIELDSGIPVGTAYSVDGASAVQDLAFSSLIPGTYVAAVYGYGPFDMVTVIVESASVTDRLDALASTVLAINTQAGISNSLDAKLETTLTAIDDTNQNNDGAALNSLYAFCSSVEAQRGKKLTDEQADVLIDGANGIIAALDEYASFCQ